MKTKPKITNMQWKKKILLDLPKLDMPYYDKKKIRYFKHTNTWCSLHMTFCIPNESWIKLTKYCTEHNNYISYDNGEIEITSFR